MLGPNSLQSSIISLSLIFSILSINQSHWLIHKTHFVHNIHTSPLPPCYNAAKATIIFCGDPTLVFKIVSLPLFSCLKIYLPHNSYCDLSFKNRSYNYLKISIKSKIHTGSTWSLVPLLILWSLFCSPYFKSHILTVRIRILSILPSQGLWGASSCGIDRTCVHTSFRIFLTIFSKTAITFLPCPLSNLFIIELITLLGIYLFHHYLHY